MGSKTKKASSYTALYPPILRNDQGTLHLTDLFSQTSLVPSQHVIHNVLYTVGYSGMFALICPFDL